VFGGDESQVHRVQVVLSSKDALHKDADFTIVSYDLAHRMSAALEARKFKIVIADESHHIKSPKAKRTKSVIPLLQRAPHALLLSGTPALNRPIELYTQLNAIRPKLFDNQRDFGDR
jgi:SWI/SNF-related matrix-associated actin-dependent regulator 1 of chromatin subfamily A